MSDTPTRTLTDAQDEAARGYYDPEHVLTDTELAETALDGLRVAAAELRAQVKWLEHLLASRGTDRSRQNVNSAYALVVRALRKRADELDGGAR